MLHHYRVIGCKTLFLTYTYIERSVEFVFTNEKFDKNTNTQTTTKIIFGKIVRDTHKTEKKYRTEYVSLVTLN